MKPIEFWLSLTSPYSYLAAMRVFDQMETTDLTFTWRPVFIPPLYKALGWKVNPFVDHPGKQEYMFKDVKREADHLRIEFHRPAVFPQNAELATKVALLAARQGFGAEFCHAAMVANFRDQSEIASEETLRTVLETFCTAREAAGLLRESCSKEAALALNRQCELALECGVFGVPTFFVGGQQFWGNDRLDRALSFAKKTESRG